MNIIDGTCPRVQARFARAARKRSPIHASNLPPLSNASGSKRKFRWAHPQELRIAALQALQKF